MERDPAVNQSERRRYRTRGNVEKEIYILGATVLESPRGPVFNRRYARDEECLREPARLPRRVWEVKRHTRSKGGPATYERSIQQAYG